MRRFLTTTVALVTLSLSGAALAVPPSAEDGSLASLAEASLRSGQYGVAAALARKAIQAEPAVMKPYLVLGLALDSANDYEGAASAYRVVASHTPQRHKALLLLARALQRSGDIDGAVRAFAQAEAERPAGIRTAAR